MSSVSTRSAGEVAGRVGSIALRPDQRLPWAVPAAVAASWTTLVAVQARGSHLLDHDAIFEGGRGNWAAVGLFMVGWLVMVSAMMLPASLPAIRDVATREAGVGVFLGGFGVVWALFGWAGLSLDSVVHRTVDAQPWLGARPHLVAAGLLTAIGVLQFTPLKRRCLAACGHWMVGSQDAGRRSGSFLDGARYGRLCLGCDGGLMLLMFAAGGSGVAGMAVLSIVVAVERKAGLKSSVHRWIGAVVLTAAAVAVASEL